MPVARRYLGIDWGNTLLDTREAHKNFAKDSFEFICQKYDLNVNEREYLNADNETRKEIRSFYNGSIKRHAWGVYEKHLLKKLGLQISDDEAALLAKQLHTLLLKYLKLKPCAITLIELAKTKGMDIIIISNANSEKIEREIAVCGVGKYFKAIISSDVCGGDKKTGLPFKVAREKLGIPLENMVMIGDREDEDGAISQFGGVYISGVDLCKAKEQLENLK